MTFLQLVQQFCQRTGVATPVSAIGSVNAQVSQIVGLANEVCEDLIDRGLWEELTKQIIFTSVDGEDQGLLDTITGPGFRSILQETIYDRTLRLPLYGPLTASQWQALKALPTTGPFYKYRIRGGRLLFNPSGAAGHECAFEIATDLVVAAADGVTFKSYFTLDTDTFRLDDRLMIAGLRWKWKSEKGLDYAEDFSRYETLVNNALGRDATKPELSMNAGYSDYRPGIFVPLGNWPV